MTIKGHTPVILGCLLLFLSASTALLSFKYGLSLGLVFLGLAACGISLYLAIRAPQLFLVAVMFAPQWKTYWPLSSIDHVVDLTLVLLAVLAGCLVCRLLAHMGRLDQLGVGHVLYGQSGPILAYLLFAASVTISYLYTTAPEYGASKLFRLLGIGSLLLIAPMFLIRTEEEFRRFARMFLVFSGATVIQLISGTETSSGDSDVTRIGAGWLVGMAAIIVLFYPLFKSESTQRVFLVCALPFLVVGLIASVARGPLVALSIVILIRLVLWFHEGHRRTAIALAGIVMASGVGAYYVLRDAGGHRYANKVRELVRLVEGNTTRGSAATRIDFYRTTLAAIPDHPFLGQGVGSWSVFYYGRDGRAYPHNLFLEVAFEEGLLGLSTLLLFLTCIYMSILWLWKETKSRHLMLGVMVLYCLIVGMFSGDLDDNRLLWLWIGMTLAVCRTIKLQTLVDVPLRVIPAASVSGAFHRPSWLHS